MEKKVLVTGASGFLGQDLCAALLEDGQSVRALVRNEKSYRKTVSGQIEYLETGDLRHFEDWELVLRDIECVYHCAAKTHDMGARGFDRLDEFMDINVMVTKALANHAVNCGVKRFVFISSVKVNGESTSTGQPFKGDVEPAPEDSYGVSKLRAEGTLHEIADSSPLEVVVVRPVLIYGRGVKGNLNRLVSLVGKKIPLPLRGIKNERSMVGIRNLVDLIMTCGQHHAAAGETFFASDGNPISTSDLVTKICQLLEVPNLAFFVPKIFLRVGGIVLRRSHEVERLLGSLAVDIEKNERVLNWVPKYSFDDELREMFSVVDN